MVTGEHLCQMAERNVFSKLLHSIEEARKTNVFFLPTLSAGLPALDQLARFRALLITILIVIFISGCSSVSCRNAASITGQPANQTVALGEPAVFTVAATGAQAYQWLKNGAPISGATQATYITPPSTTGDSGSSFSVSVSNYLGQIASSRVTLTVVPFASTEVRFVAPSGSDVNAGTIDQPYQTIQHCASTIGQGGTCEIRAGTYRETVVPNSNITITAYHFETVVVDGSDPVTGWTLDHGSVFKAKVLLNSDDSNQIFVGSDMMTEARWPNGNDLFYVNWATAAKGTNGSQIIDPKLPKVNWTGAKVHLWSGQDPFGNQTGKVTSSGSGQIGIDVGQAGTCPFICPAEKGYYYLYGTLNALDAEREWFYDVDSTTLYFFAPRGADPNQIDVRGKQRSYAFDLRGKTGVTVANISIFASTIITDETSSQNMLDRINAMYVSQFTDLPPATDDLNGASFSILDVHRKDTGIIVTGTGNTIQNSKIAYSAGSGIALSGKGNILRNNLIENVDYVGDYASGIDMDGDNNTIQYNTILTVGRQGIYIQGVTNEDISYNNIFDGMLLSRDGGEIYACCNQVAAGTRIHHNWLHDTQALIGGQGDSYPLSGLGIDNGSSGFQVDQNVLWDNKQYNILINGVTGTIPNNNHIVNNTIPDSSSGAHIGITLVQQCTSTSIVDNKVVSDVTNLNNGNGCMLSNNQSTAPGATDMSASAQVGCNFAGCASTRPPEITGDSVTSCPVNPPLTGP
jgi:Right handed beta helix region